MRLRRSIRERSQFTKGEPGGICHLFDKFPSAAAAPDVPRRQAWQRNKEELRFQFKALDKAGELRCLQGISLRIAFTIDKDFVEACTAGFYQLGQVSRLVSVIVAREEQPVRFVLSFNKDKTCEVCAAALTKRQSAVQILSYLCECL